MVPTNKHDVTGLDETKLTMQCKISQGILFTSRVEYYCSVCSAVGRWVAFLLALFSMDAHGLLLYHGHLPFVCIYKPNLRSLSSIRICSILAHIKDMTPFDPDSIAQHALLSCLNGGLIEHFNDLICSQTHNTSTQRATTISQ